MPVPTAIANTGRMPPARSHLGTPDGPSDAIPHTAYRSGAKEGLIGFGDPVAFWQKVEPGAP
jgi:hypothetical protein